MRAQRPVSAGTFSSQVARQQMLVVGDLLEDRSSLAAQSMTPNSKTNVLQNTLRIGQNTNQERWSGPLNIAVNGEFQQDVTKEMMVQIGSRQIASQKQMVIERQSGETQLSQASRFQRLKSNEDKEKKIQMLRADQRFHTIFVKMWKLTFLESNQQIDLQMEDFPTVQVPSNSFFNLMARIERALYSLRPDFIKIELGQKEQSISMFVKQQLTMLDMQEYVLRFVFGDFLSIMSPAQIENCLRDIYSHIVTRNNQGQILLRNLESIPIDAEGGQQVANRIDKKIAQLKVISCLTNPIQSQKDLTIRSSLRPQSAVRKGRPLSGAVNKGIQNATIVSSQKNSVIWSPSSDFKLAVPELEGGAMRTPKQTKFEFSIPLLNSSYPTTTLAQAKVNELIHSISAKSNLKAFDNHEREPLELGSVQHIERALSRLPDSKPSLLQRRHNSVKFSSVDQQQGWKQQQEINTKSSFDVFQHPHVKPLPANELQCVENLQDQVVRPTSSVTTKNNANQYSRYHKSVFMDIQRTDSDFKKVSRIASAQNKTKQQVNRCHVEYTLKKEILSGTLSLSHDVQNEIKQRNNSPRQKMYKTNVYQLMSKAYKDKKNNQMSTIQEVKPAKAVKQLNGGSRTETLQVKGDEAPVYVQTHSKSFFRKFTPKQIPEIPKRKRVEQKRSYHLFFMPQNKMNETNMKLLKIKNQTGIQIKHPFISVIQTRRGVSNKSFEHKDGKEIFNINKGTVERNCSLESNFKSTNYLGAKFSLRSNLGTLRPQSGKSSIQLSKDRTSNHTANLDLNN